MKHNAFALSMNPASCTVDFILAQTMTRIRQGRHKFATILAIESGNTSEKRFGVSVTKAKSSLNLPK